MSAIGSFYIINDEKRDAVVHAAEMQSKALTKKRFGFFAPKLPIDPDPFWVFIATNTRELEHLPYSGDILLEIESLAPNSLSSSDDLGSRLFQITQSTFISYRPADAIRAIGLMDRADFSDVGIKRFLSEQGREDYFPDMVASIQDSAARMKNWLNAVEEGNTGILSIG